MLPAPRHRRPTATPPRDRRLNRKPMGATQNIYCAFQMAQRGYYPQSLNLLRPPVEYWMSYWYLRSFPEEHARFTNMAAGSEETPRYNDMLQKIEARHGMQP